MFQHRLFWVISWFVAAWLLAGCGGSSKPPAGPKAKKAVRAPIAKRTDDGARPGRRASSQPKTPAASPDESPAPKPVSEANSPPVPADSPVEEPKQRRENSLAALLAETGDAMPRMIPDLPRMNVDETKAAAAGIRKLSAKHLTLYTDLESDEQVDVLPEVFDRAFPQWCEYFGIDPAKHPDWSMTGFLMKDKARFQRARLLPATLPPFEHGYCRNYEFWLYEQPSAYYRRHLVLHEGTHGFMNTMLGGCGPPWYMEGIAELLATHRWADGKLTMNYLPATREEVPMWGRIKIVRDAVAAGQGKYLHEVMKFGPTAHRQTEPYGWCWAAATLLDRHPGYCERFRRLYHLVLEPDLSGRFYQMMADDWEELSEEWQVFISTLEYGHNVPKTAIEFTPGRPLAPGGSTVTVAADRGWQSSGVQLEGGTTYRLRASGRYQVADQPQIWWCEPGGVSIRYYQGRPLGILLAAVRPDKPQNAPSVFFRPEVVGLGTVLTPEQTGTLYFKINDSAAELDDNAGTLSVEIQRN